MYQEMLYASLRENFSEGFLKKFRKFFSQNFCETVMFECLGAANKLQHRTFVFQFLCSKIGKNVEINITESFPNEII